MRVNPDVRFVINGFCKPLITSRKSIPHLSNAEFGLNSKNPIYLVALNTPFTQPKP